MKLLTKELRKKLPALYATESIPLKDKIAVAKFFHPASAYTFYVIEGSPVVDEQDNEVDYTFFGWATHGDPTCAEFGYASLNELQSVRGKLGLGIERDMYFSPTPLKDISEIKIYD